MNAINSPGDIPSKKTILERISYIKVKYVCVVKTHMYKIRMCH